MDLGNMIKDSKGGKGNQGIDEGGIEDKIHAWHTSGEHREEWAGSTEMIIGMYILSRNT